MRMAALAAMGLASCTAPNPDYVPSPTGCMVGSRGCTGTRPVVCVPGDGGTRLNNATCPSAAACSDGACVPTNGQCRSDLCLQFGSRQLCFLACSVDADCSPTQRCRKLPVTVTGVQGTI